MIAASTPVSHRALLDREYADRHRPATGLLRLRRGQRVRWRSSQARPRATRSRRAAVGLHALHCGFSIEMRAAAGRRGEQSSVPGLVRAWNNMDVGGFDAAHKISILAAPPWLSVCPRRPTPPPRSKASRASTCWTSSWPATHRATHRSWWPRADPLGRTACWCNVHPSLVAAQLAHPLAQGGRGAQRPVHRRRPGSAASFLQGPGAGSESPPPRPWPPTSPM